MMQGSGSSLTMLRALVGEDVLTADAATLAPWETDHRRLFRGKALALARPRDTATVSRILAFCNSQKIGVVTVGGNTSYCGGATPDSSGTQLVLSLGRMDRIRAIDTQNLSMTVESGCILAKAQQAAAAVDRYFPLSLGSQGSCQLGGNLATNAGGLNVLRYGMARDLVLGLEVVLADGRVLETLTTLRKDNTGYDLKSLFIGSEGTLGVITAAALKLFPAQHDVATALVAVRDPDAALELLALLRENGGEKLSSFELIPRIAFELVQRHCPQLGRSGMPDTGEWQVLVELTDSTTSQRLSTELQDSLALAAEKGLIGDAMVAGSIDQARQFWRWRESIPEAQRLDGASLKHDLSLPQSRIAEFLTRVQPLLASCAPDGFLVAYGHLGDGNLHFNVNQRQGSDRATFLAREPTLKRAIHDLVHELGGSFSAEHGIGQLKVDELARYASSVELDLMRTIKRSLDPNGILNPGKLLRT